MSRLHAHKHTEHHAVSRIGWLRAAVLGANDGIVSTASLIVGVAASGAAQSAILIAGVAGLVAGALSMAAGEYVSVSSQLDAEKADLDLERQELRDEPEREREELVNIYISRGLDTDLANKVADQLTAKDALGAHARDELGLSEMTTAQPTTAALSSAAAFTAGAVLPLVVVVAAPAEWTVSGVAISSVLFLALLGALGARAGGANMLKSVIRVTLLGSAALLVTAGIGRLFGAPV
jgi:vacuolar iron transporter family protein